MGHRWGGGGRWRVQAGGAMGDGSSCSTLRGGPGLDVVEHLGCLAANGEVAHVGFDRVVHSHVKRREEVEDAVFVAVVSTAWDAAVEVEAEEGKAKVRDVLDVVDDHLLASHFNGDGSFVENVNLAVVSERDVLVVDVVLLNEGLIGQPNMVGGPTVQNIHLAGGCACSCRDDGLTGGDRRLLCLR